MEITNIVLNEKTGSNLTCILQPVEGKYVFDKRPAIIVIPGGAYAYCSDREAEPVALRYSSYGYQSFVLRYTCRDQANWPTPLEEYEHAMEIIKENADKWHIDTSRIATIGFSAGGHLAACTATIAKNKPNATILIYPVILKEIADCCMPNLPIMNESVDIDTVPCFLVACRDDPTVHISNLVAFEMELAKAGIPFESHIYSYGGHGFSIVDTVNYDARTSSRAKNWFIDSIGWLDENFGKLHTGGFTKPNPQVAKNGDSKEQLSIDCTYNHLKKQNQDVQQILKPFYSRFDEMGFGINVSSDTIQAAFGYNTLRQLLNELHYSEEEIASFNQQLQQHKNQK